MIENVGLAVMEMNVEMIMLMLAEKEVLAVIEMDLEMLTMLIE